MSFAQHVTVTSLDILLDALMDFAEDYCGFTRLADITGTGRQSDMYVLQKGSMYWWFLGNSLSDAEYGTYGIIESRMMTTAPTLGNRETLDLGQRKLTQTFLYDKPNGSYTNAFFYGDSSTEAVHCVIEVSPNVFAHLSFGSITKSGTWTGGEYLSGSDIVIASGYSASSGFTWSDSTNRLVFGGSGTADTNTGYLYYPYESQGDQRDWSAMHVSTSALTDGRRTRPMACVTQTSSPIGPLMSASPSAHNDRSLLIPAYLWVYDNRTGGSLRNIAVGVIPNAALINMTNISPKAIVYNDWDVYPQFQKSGDAFDAPISGFAGVAYKRIV